MRRISLVSLLTVAGLLLAGQTACVTTVAPPGDSPNDDINTNGDTNTNGETPDGGNPDGDGPGTFTAVKTNIDVHNSGRIAVGDDILVYGYGGFSGVGYIVPSAGDTAGRAIPDGDSYRASAFAALGKKIALVNNFVVTIYDTTSDSAVEVPEASVRLTNTPVGLYDQGQIKASGPYLAVRNDNGSKVGVIDTSGDTPVVINFDNDVVAAVEEVAIDADTMQVVAVAGDTFYIYDLSDPAAVPTVWDASSVGGIGDGLVHVSDGYIFYEDGEAFGNARFVDIETGSVTTLGGNLQAGELAADGGSFCYFVDRDANDSNGSDRRSGVGSIPGSGASLAGDEEIDGSTTNNGFVGWAQHCVVTPDGSLTFLSGKTSIGSGEFLQVSSGAAFSVVADVDGSSPYGLPATDVATSANVVGFKTGDGTTAGTDTKVGYIVLD